MNILINTALATFLPTGSIALLYYADRVSQLPLGLIGVAIGSVVLPRMAAEQQGRAMHQHYALLYGVMLALPAAVGLWLLALPIVRVLFVHGHFLSQDAAAAASVLQAFAIGVPAFVLVRIVVSFFYARQAHTEPMRAALWGLIANLVFALTLMPVLAIQGLALAISCAAWFQLAFLFFLLYRRGWITQVKKMLMMLAKMMLATLIMAAALVLMKNAYQPIVMTGWVLWMAFLSLSILAAMLLYGCMCWRMRVFKELL